MNCIARIQSYVDADCIFPVYRFGCVETRDRTVLGLDGGQAGQEIHGVENIANEVFRRAENVTFSGPTSLSPVIQKMTDIVRDYVKTGQPVPHLVAVIFVNSETVTRTQDSKLLKDVCGLPVSFVLVSIEDTFDSLRLFDKGINSSFDNVHYTSIPEVLKKLKSPRVAGEKEAVAVVVDMFSELQAQHDVMVQRGLVEG